MADVFPIEHEIVGSVFQRGVVQTDDAACYNTRNIHFFAGLLRVYEYVF